MVAGRAVAVKVAVDIEMAVRVAEATVAEEAVWKEVAARGGGGGSRRRWRRRVVEA